MFATLESIIIAGPVHQKYRTYSITSDASIYKYKHMCMCIRSYLYLYIYACTNTYIYIYIYIQIHTYTRTNKHTNMQTYMHTYNTAGLLSDVYNMCVRRFTNRQIRR